MVSASANSTSWRLERNSVEYFPLHWTVVHPITAESPLRGVTPEQFAAAQPEHFVHVSAHEDTFSTQVTTRTSYVAEDFRWDVKFASSVSGGRRDCDRRRPARSAGPSG